MLIDFSAAPRGTLTSFAARRAPTFAFLALALVAHVPAFAQARPTIAQFLSPGFPSDLVSAKNTDRIAWIVYERGMRNVYTAAAPDFRATRLTKFLTQLRHAQVPRAGIDIDEIDVSAAVPRAISRRDESIGYCP